MRRYDRLREILRLDPEADCELIYRLMASYEFPWDFTRALELALYRTYAVPSIGRLLAQTAELTTRSQKRYDDTALLLDDISNDDMRYVLSTFVVIPKRWLDSYGWRSLTEHELTAVAAYYRMLGRRMGIREIPPSYAAFERFLDDYEAAHFGFDHGGRAVSDATLDLMASWYPRPLAPLARRATTPCCEPSVTSDPRR